MPRSGSRNFGANEQQLGALLRLDREHHHARKEGRQSFEIVGSPVTTVPSVKAAVAMTSAPIVRRTSTCLSRANTRPAAFAISTDRTIQKLFQNFASSKPSFWKLSDGCRVTIPSFWKLSEGCRITDPSFWKLADGCRITDPSFWKLAEVIA
ncbi:MAG TPA: hypothetical protein VHV51_03870 [Polyangiaceae bacterium]|nr:hypothetical protein [Polyangiaceae bacterium]